MEDGSPANLQLRLNFLKIRRQTEKKDRETVESLYQEMKGTRMYI